MDQALQKPDRGLDSPTILLQLADRESDLVW